MSFWKGLFAAGRGGPGPLDDFWYGPAGSSGVTWAGVPMSADAALRIATVYACVRVIAEDVAKQPLPAYRRDADGGKELAPDHYLDRLLHSGEPNSEQTDFEFREMMMAWAALRGKANAEIRPGRRGLKDMELLPIPPASIREERQPDGTKRWRVREDDGTERVLLREDLFILTGPMGLSVVELARQSFGLAQAGESYRAHGYANNMTPTIVLEHPANLSKPAQDRLKQSVQERSGVANAKRPLILEEGMKANALQLTAEDAQWLEGQKFSAEEIAGRWFRMQLHKVGLLDHATYSNIEHQNIEHATDTILPWNVRFEKAVRRQLLLPADRATVFVEHNMDGLLRGDIQTRYSAYAIARQWGFMSANDIRRRENMNPIADGDIYLEPMNMVPAGTDRSQLRQGAAPAAAALAEPPTVREAERVLRDAGLTRSEARAVLARRGAGLRDASDDDGEE